MFTRFLTITYAAGANTVFTNWSIAPELIILGGGISRKSNKHKDVIDMHMLIVPSASRNKAGIIVAAATTEQAR